MEDRQKRNREEANNNSSNISKESKRRKEVPQSLIKPSQITIKCKNKDFKLKLLLFSNFILPIYYLFLDILALNYYLQYRPKLIGLLFKNQVSIHPTDLGWVSIERS